MLIVVKSIMILMGIARSVKPGSKGRECGIILTKGALGAFRRGRAALTVSSYHIVSYKRVSGEDGRKRAFPSSNQRKQ